MLLVSKILRVPHAQLAGSDPEKARGYV